MFGRKKKAQNNEDAAAQETPEDAAIDESSDDMSSDGAATPLGAVGAPETLESPEQALAEWLAHPHEFGVAPVSVERHRSYDVELTNYGPTQVHLLTYEMPDGTAGRGFVNPITWSFLGDGVEAIDDDDLLVAYAGWSWLFPAMSDGQVVTEFDSDGEQAAFEAQLQASGVTEVEFLDRYKIGTSELFEFVGTSRGVPLRGAGNTEIQVVFNHQEPNAKLPAIYFALGRAVMN